MDDNGNSIDDTIDAADDAQNRVEEMRNNRLLNFLSNTKAGRNFRMFKWKTSNAVKRAVKGAFKSGTRTLLGTVIGIFAWIFVVIGLIVFEFTAPGMMFSGMFDKVDAAYKGLKKFFLGGNALLSDQSEEIRNAQLDLLNYIQSMGFDVVEYGFVSSASKSQNENGDEVINDFQDNLFTDEYMKKYDRLGTTSNKATIYRYVISALRIYALNDDGFLGKLFGDSTQKGMLNIVNDSLFSTGENIFQKVKVDYDNKRIELEQLNPHIFEFLNFDKFSFNIDGWAGRFGFPLDLSLTLHLATMSSDMVEELITNPDLETMVNIDIIKATADIEYVLKNDEGIEIKYKRKKTTEVDDPLYKRYVAAGRDVSKMDIEQKDVSIVGIVRLVFDSTMEIQNSTSTVKYNGRELVSSEQAAGQLFGGIKKCMDALNAMLGSGRFAATNVNPVRFGYDYDENVEYFYSGKKELITRSPYVCDVNEDGTMNSNTGILGIHYYDSQGIEYGFKDIGSRYQFYYGDLTEINPNYQPSSEELSAVKKYIEKFKENFVPGGNSINSTDPSKIQDAWYFAIPYNVGWHWEGNFLTAFPLDGLNSRDIARNMYVKADRAFDYAYDDAYADANNHDDISPEDVGRIEQEFRKLIRKNADRDTRGGVNDYTQFLRPSDRPAPESQERYNCFTEILGYYRVLRYIDSFIYSYALHDVAEYEIGEDNILYITENGWNDINNKFNYDFNKNPLAVTSSDASDPNIGNGYYSEWFLDICVEAGRGNPNAFNQLFGDNGLLAQLSHDRDIIQEYMNKSNKVAEEILEKVGYEGLSMDDVYLIYQNAKFDAEDIEFLQPRIVSVVKHWFKDLSFKDAYEQTKEPFEVKYTKEIGVEDHGWYAAALITPQDEIYRQIDQPYVVKGDIVTVDGEVKDVSKSDLGDTEFDDYNWGDGYRATKRIFTQGFYYTYDGTEETSKSVYLQKQVEAMRSGGGVGTCYITVQNGRVKHFRLLKDGESISSGEEIYNKDGVRIARVERETEEDGNIKQERNSYILEIQASAKNSSYGAMHYFSAGDKKNSYEDTKSSAERINAVWDAVGVIVKRKPLTFDTSDTNGQAMATAAFSILENSKSPDAEAIYRDLKELLLDLGYYTKAEFDALSTDVLEWFIPDYTPEQWPQNSLDDIMEYGCMIYPYKEEEKEDEDSDTNNDDSSGNNNSNSQEETSDNSENSEDSESEVKEGRSDGFEQNLEIIAPGDCKIITYDDTMIKIKFDSTNQPEIGIVDKYTMIIKGAKLLDTQELTFVDEDGNEVTMSIADIIENKVTIPSRTVIGYTGTEKIQVVMKNNREAYINDVYDYMSPENTKIIEKTVWDYFHFIPYESGPIDAEGWGPACVASFAVDGETEYAIGICQWTIRGSMNNITPFINDLYAKDPSLCAELKMFVNKDSSYIINNYEQLKQAFKKIDQKDHDEFFKLQTDYAFAEKKQTMDSKGLDWIYGPDRHGAVSGALMSLLNWRPAWDWEKRINPNMTDEEIIKTLFAYAYFRSGGSDVTAGWRMRWESQARLGVDLVTGAYTDAEEFVRNGAVGDGSAYANENPENRGYLEKTLEKNGWKY